jgi:hypothetical protein
MRLENNDLQILHNTFQRIQLKICEMINHEF